MSGRDSIRLRFTPRSANSCSTRTRLPGASGRPQKTIEVFQAPGVGGRAVRAVGSGVPAPATRSGSRCRDGPRRPPAAPCSRTARRTRRGPERGPGLARTRPRSGPRRRCCRPARPRACGRRSRRNRGALGARLRMRDARARSRPAPAASRAIRQCRIGMHHLADDLRRSSVSNTSASSVALTEPSSEFSIGTSARSALPFLHRHHAVVDRRHAAPARRLARRRRRSSASSLKVPSGPRNATRTRRSLPDRRPARRRARSRSPRSPRARARTPARPSRTPLTYMRACSRWRIEDSTTPVPDVVQQRHRARLAAAHLAVGVVADHRRLADRPVEPPLVAVEPAVELRERLLDRRRSSSKLALQRLGVRDQVALPRLAEHRSLGAAAA